MFSFSSRDTILIWVLIVFLKGLGTNKIWWSKVSGGFAGYEMPYLDKRYFNIYLKISLAFASSLSIAAVACSFVCIWISLASCEMSSLDTFLWFLWLSQAQYTGLFQNTNGLEHWYFDIFENYFISVFPGANGETFPALGDVNLSPQLPPSARERRRIKQKALECGVCMITKLA